MLRVLIIAAILAVSVSAYAQQPPDPLTTCLADSTSGKDRKDLAKWLFFAMAAHSEIRQYTGANAATAADESSRTVATMVVRLLTEACVRETRAVIKSGQGAEALELAFGSLGKLAMQELMSDKSVQESMNSYLRYVDATRLMQALSGK
jgi:hypothetical protein